MRICIWHKIATHFQNCVAIWWNWVAFCYATPAMLNPGNSYYIVGLYFQNYKFWPTSVIHPTLLLINEQWTSTVQKNPKLKLPARWRLQHGCWRGFFFSPYKRKQVNKANVALPWLLKTPNSNLLCCGAGRGYFQEKTRFTSNKSHPDF